jgi:hydrogenase maturation protease
MEYNVNVNNDDHIVVLGVGNLLQTDEGVGVRVVQELLETVVFPPNVDVVDGGVLGLSLMGVIKSADKLIVVDAVRLGGNPGDLFRFSWEEIIGRTNYKDSLHQVDFVETMSLLPLIARVPPTVILGVEPADIDSFGLALTSCVSARIPDLVRLVLEELAALGIHPSVRELRNDVSGRTRPNH